MRDFYKEYIKTKIKKYNKVINNQENIIYRIKRLQEKKTSISITWGNDPIQGGGTGYEDRLLNINAEIELLKNNLKENEELIEELQKAMNTLTEKEKTIILKLNNSDNFNEADHLAAKYNYSRAQIYRISNAAIEKIAYKLYGNY